MKIDREKTLFDVLYSKQAFLNKKNRFEKPTKLAFLERGYSMVLVKNLKFFHLLYLSKIDREKVFADVLDKKRTL